jgi:hypothetical protein
MASRLLSFVALAILFFCLGANSAAAAPPQSGWNQGSGFLGQWCAQGDPSKPASISANGPFFSLTNEQGSTSSGHLDRPNQNVIIADQWQFVRGTLSPDGNQINWSNGTFWAKCYSGGGGGGHRRPNLQGTWYRGGNRSLACSIQQRKDTLTFTNEQGQTARGQFLSSRRITANWGGQTINGTLTNNAGQINWDNGTMWSR